MVAAGAQLFRLDAGVYFFTVNSNIFRRVNADSDLTATHAEHGDVDLASNGDGFADATGQYQHAIPLNWFRKYQRHKHTRNGACLTNYNRLHAPSGRRDLSRPFCDLSRRSMEVPYAPTATERIARQLAELGARLRL